MPQFWGKGYATEALISLINLAKQNVRSTDKIVAFTSIQHKTSERVMQKAGMKFGQSKSEFY